MIEDILSYRDQFLALDYANEIMMGLGVLVLIVAALKIIRSSLKIFFWVVLGSLGAFSFTYGLNNGSGYLPVIGDSTPDIDLAEIVRSGKEDVLRVLCERLPGYMSESNPLKIE